MRENRPGGADDRYVPGVRQDTQEAGEGAVIFCKGRSIYWGKESELMNDLDTFIPPYMSI